MSSSKCTSLAVFFLTPRQRPQPRNSTLRMKGLRTDPGCVRRMTAGVFVPSVSQAVDLHMTQQASDASVDIDTTQYVFIRSNAFLILTCPSRLDELYINVKQSISRKVLGPPTLLSKGGMYWAVATPRQALSIKADLNLFPHFSPAVPLLVGHGHLLKFRGKKAPEGCERHHMPSDLCICSCPHSRGATHRDGAASGVGELDVVLPHRGAKDERAGGRLAHLEQHLCLRDFECNGLVTGLHPTTSIDPQSLTSPPTLPDPPSSTQHERAPTPAWRLFLTLKVRV